MLHQTLTVPDKDRRTVLANMFAARKRVFVDLLGWDLPVSHGLYEIDQFDTPEATYIVLTDASGQHRASARLLPTCRPHILDSLFPMLSKEAIPKGPTVREITRFCLDRSLRAAQRRIARDALVHALVRYALAHGIERYTGVADKAWLDQILDFGWDCRTLGMPRFVDGACLGALLITIARDTPDRLMRAGLRDTAGDGGERCHVL